MPRHRSVAALLAALCVLAATLHSDAAAPDAIAAIGAPATALQTAEPLGYPVLDIVSVTQRGGLTAATKQATLDSAFAIGAPAAYGRGFQLGLRRVKRGAAVVRQSTGDGWGYPMSVTALPL